MGDIKSFESSSLGHVDAVLILTALAMRSRALDRLKFVIFGSVDSHSGALRLRCSCACHRCLVGDHVCVPTPTNSEVRCITLC
jgi:hypothetical protein